MSLTPGYAAWKLSTDVTPLILTRGVAANFGLGGLLPIVALTEGVSFLQNLLFSGNPANVTDLDQYFAHWVPLPGTKLSSQQVAMVPMANQAIAANATIAQPLPVSMMMICPAKGTGGYPAKFATLTALKRTIDQHNAAGGTYTVVTASAIYTDCLFLDITDVSGAESGKQRQVMWKWDFTQPLVSVSAVDSAVNTLMSKLQQFLPLGGPSQAAPASGLSIGNLASSIFGGSSGIVSSVGGSVQAALQVPP